MIDAKPSAITSPVDMLVRNLGEALGGRSRAVGEKDVAEIGVTSDPRGPTSVPVPVTMSGVLTVLEVPTKVLTGVPVPTKVLTGVPVPTIPSGRNPSRRDGVIVERDHTTTNPRPIYTWSPSLLPSASPCQLLVPKHVHIGLISPVQSKQNVGESFRIWFSVILISELGFQNKKVNLKRKEVAM